MNKVFSKISEEENPAGVDELDVLISSNPEFVRELAMRRIGANAFLHLRGFIQIYTISGRLICSDNGNFKDFTQLIGGLENPEPGRSRLHSWGGAEPKICFKMFATVPSASESN